jgi:alpha-glucosidase
MRRAGRSPFAIFALAGLAFACNGLVGNADVSVWNPDAAATDATTVPFGDEGDGGGDGDARWAPDAALGAAPSDAPADAGGALTPPPVGIALEIVSDYSGTCVDVGSTKESGSVLSLTVCQNLAEQLLVLRGAGASYSMFNPNSGKCVGVEEDGGIPNGTGLALQSCSDASTQMFTVEGSTGAYVFVSKAGGSVCLDDAARGASSGTPVVVYSCNSGPNQTWNLVP